MTAYKTLPAAAIFSALFFSLALSQDQSATAGSAKPFLGRWNVTLKAPDREYPSLLELAMDNGQLKAEMVGRWGNARPLPQVELSKGELTFISPKEEEGRKDDMVFHAKLVGGRLEGSTTGPDGTPWPFVGVRAPSLKRSAPKANPESGVPL